MTHPPFPLSGTVEGSALGRATADVHLDLARLFPHPEATPDQRATLVAAWHRRLRIALAEVPQLAPWADDIRHRYTAAEAAPWPRLQRVHGDYHLGQVLQVPGRGWVLLDFEGEPMRPMGERSAPDLALRDVAGMLRSFDYVEGSLTLARSQTTGLDADARELVRLLNPIHAKVNLIPFNPWPGAPYECSSNNRIHRFAEIVNDGGLSAPVRTPRGRDISAACGQLKSASLRQRGEKVAL